MQHPARAVPGAAPVIRDQLLDAVRAGCCIVLLGR
jgi:hypothetical protein